MSILAKFVELGTLKSSEIRRILIDMGLPLTMEEVAAQPITKPSELPPAPEQPQLSAEKKHEVTPREY